MARASAMSPIGVDEACVHVIDLGAVHAGVLQRDPSRHGRPRVRRDAAGPCGTRRRSPHSRAIPRTARRRAHGRPPARAPPCDALAHDEAVAVAVEGPGGTRRRVVVGRRECPDDVEGPNARRSGAPRNPRRSPRRPGRRAGPRAPRRAPRCPRRTSWPSTGSGRARRARSRGWPGPRRRTPPAPGSAPPGGCPCRCTARAVTRRRRSRRARRRGRSRCAPGSGRSGHRGRARRRARAARRRGRTG